MTRLSISAENATQVHPQVAAEIVRRQAQQSAMPALQNILLATAATGAGIAALQRFARLRKEQQAAKKDQSRDSSVRLFKNAGDNGLASRFAKFWNDTTSGQYAQKPGDLPWFPATAALTGGAGLAGGYLLADRGLFKPLEQSSQKAELEKAKREYEQALASFLQYRKTAAETGEERCKLAVSFDKIEESIMKSRRKQAEGGAASSPVPTYDDGATAARFGSKFLGLALLAMGGAGLAGAYKGYKDKSKSSKTRAAEQAVLERRLANRPRVRPTVVEAPPRPVQAIDIQEGPAEEYEEDDFSTVGG